MRYASVSTQGSFVRVIGMGTKAGTKYVAGDRNSCRCAMPSAAGQLTAVPHHAAANVPGVATVALYRELPAPHCHGDKLAVGLHLGPRGWMDWHTPEHGRRRVLVPAGSLSLVPARASVWWQRARPSEFLLVALEPRFVADASGRGEEITWCPMPVFQDPMIARYDLRLAGGGARWLSLGTPLQHLAVHRPGYPFGTPLRRRRGTC